MARIRTIKPDIWEDRKIGRCSILARLNFHGLISMADDEGRGQGDLKWLMGRLHAFMGGLTEDSMSESLAELEKVGCVVFYEVNGERYYWLPNFLKHQRINRPTPSRIPAYSGNSHGPIHEESGSLHGGLNAGRDRIGLDLGTDGSGARSGADRSGSTEGAAASAKAPAAPTLAEKKAAAKKLLGVEP